jgi:hypothetical protein
LECFKELVVLFFCPALARLGYGIGFTDLLAGARAGGVVGGVGHGLRVGRRSGIHGALRFMRARGKERDRGVVAWRGRFS